MCRNRFVPGAEHISKIVSPSWGSRTWPATIDGKFCKYTNSSPIPLKAGNK